MGVGVRVDLHTPQRHESGLADVVISPVHLERSISAGETKTIAWTAIGLCDLS